MKNLGKRIFMTAVCAAMVCSIAGCTSPETIKFVKDGTYTGSATGYQGDLEVSVEYKDNKMTNVTVTKNSESGVVAYSALKNIPSYIVENQSVNVDVSTGATTTSKAICSAVASTVTAAGGNLEQWQTDCTGKHEDKVVNYTTQAVVVGGGYSGIITALRLRQQGIETLLVEKESKVGGSLNYMYNATQITAGSSLLRKDGEAEEKPEKIAEDLYSYGNSKGNEDLLNLLADNIGTVTDWQVKDLGIAFDDRYVNAGYSTNAVRYYNTDDAELNELLTKEVKVSGTKIVPNSSVIGIDYEDGKAVGVTAKNLDGSVVKVKADYIVLASGSYGSNQSLLNTSSSLYYGPFGASGDLITVGQSEANGFAVTNELGGATFSTGLQINDSYAIDAYTAIQRSLKSGALIINQNAQRFINEDADKYTLSSAIATQTGSYIVLNKAAYKAFKSGLMENMSEELKKYVEDNGITDALDEKYKADNLEAACVTYGLDHDAVSNAVEQYNHDVKSKNDLSYGRASSTYGGSIDASQECYIIPFSLYVYEMSGGISCDATLHVLKTDGTTVNNIYVIGNACGGVFGNAIKQGAGTAWAAVSGYLAADDIASQYQDEESASPSATESASADASASEGTTN